MGYQKQEETVQQPPPQVQTSPFFAPNPAVTQPGLGNTEFASPLGESVGQQTSPIVPAVGGNYLGSPQVRPTGGTMGGGGGTGSTAQATTRPADDSDRRAFVEEARAYIRSAGEFYQLAKVDAPTFDRVLSNWLTMEANAEGIIQQLQAGGAGQPAGDPALLEATRRDFAGAIRSLMTRASAQLNKPLIRLYLENMYRLPNWAWPDSSIFMTGNPQQKRSFVGDFATSLQDAALFAGYGNLDRAKLEEILGRMRTLVDDAQVMIAGQLSNDSAMRQQLRQAYHQAIQTLLTRAATTLSTSLFNLYMQYRYGATPLIHPWGDDVVAGITAPVPQGAGAPDPITGEVNFMLNGFAVTIAPDGTQTRSGGQTTADVRGTTPGAQWTGGVITSMGPVAVPTIRIQTLYGPGATPGATSGYGRGTTAADVAHGDTTLGFHEGNHAIDFLKFIQATPAPVFRGAVRDTVTAFNTARTTFLAAITTYSRTMTRSSEISTDCVGNPNIVDFYRAQGQIPPVTCP